MVKLATAVLLYGNMNPQLEPVFQIVIIILPWSGTLKTQSHLQIHAQMKEGMSFSYRRLN